MRSLRPIAATAAAALLALLLLLPPPHLPLLLLHQPVVQWAERALVSYSTMMAPPPGAAPEPRADLLWAWDQRSEAPVLPLHFDAR